MSTIFDTTDPRGYKISCTEQCWNEHILAKRPYMHDLLNEIKETIEKPKLGFIYEDTTYKKRNIYYGSTKSADEYMKVVVEFNDDNEGTVVTAFTTSNVRPGEKLIWSTNSKN